MLECLPILVKVELLLLQPAVLLVPFRMLLVQRPALGESENDVPLVHGLEAGVGLENLLIHAPPQRDLHAGIGAAAHQQCRAPADGRALEEGAARGFVKRAVVVRRRAAALAFWSAGFRHIRTHDLTSAVGVCEIDRTNDALVGAQWL